MKNTLLLATHNKGKIREIASLLNSPRIEVMSLFDFPHLPETVEDGLTLKDNARKKALEAARATGLHVLADDSGLEVRALQGAPGVLSARFAGENCSYEDNNRKLLALLGDIPAEERQARFRTVLCFASPEGKTLFSEGELDGRISSGTRGVNGFGYDPVFEIPPYHKTLAELPLTVKNEMSHRSRALIDMKPLIFSALNG